MDRSTVFGALAYFDSKYSITLGAWSAIFAFLMFCLISRRYWNLVLEYQRLNSLSQGVWRTILVHFDVVLLSLLIVCSMVLPTLVLRPFGIYHGLSTVFLCGVNVALFAAGLFLSDMQVDQVIKANEEFYTNSGKEVGRVLEKGHGSILYTVHKDGTWRVNRFGNLWPILVALALLSFVCCQTFSFATPPSTPLTLGVSQCNIFNWATFVTRFNKGDSFCSNKTKVMFVGPENSGKTTVLKLLLPGLYAGGKIKPVESTDKFHCITIRTGGQSQELDLHSEEHDNCFFLDEAARLIPPHMNQENYANNVGHLAPDLQDFIFVDTPGYQQKYAEDDGSKFPHRLLMSELIKRVDVVVLVFESLTWKPYVSEFLKGLPLNSKLYILVNKWKDEDRSSLEMAVEKAYKTFKGTAETFNEDTLLHMPYEHDKRAVAVARKKLIARFQTVARSVAALREKDMRNSLEKFLFSSSSMSVGAPWRVTTSMYLLDTFQQGRVNHGRLYLHLGLFLVLFVTMLWHMSRQWQKYRALCALRTAQLKDKSS